MGAGSRMRRVCVTACKKLDDSGVDLPIRLGLQLATRFPGAVPLPRLKCMDRDAIDLALDVARALHEDERFPASGRKNNRGVCMSLVGAGHA